MNTNDQNNQPKPNNVVDCDPVWQRLANRPPPPYPVQFEQCFVRDLRRHIAEQVALGFGSSDQIAKDAVDVFTGDLRRLVAIILPEVIDAQLQAEVSWPAVTDCDELDAAFQELKLTGILCEHNCGFDPGDGSEEMEHSMDEELRGYAFYDCQQAMFVRDRKFLDLFFDINHKLDPLPDEKTIGQDIVAALQRHGLNPEWDDNTKSFIRVPIDWKRRWTGKGTTEPDEENSEPK
jgi:hypothetical protein